MKRLLGFAAALVIALSGTANAVPMMDFEIDGAASSVTITNQSNGFLCNLTSCGVDVELTAGLDGTSFSLAEGQSNTFNFIDWSVNGLGSATFVVEATLAFAEPAGQAVSGVGTGGFFTLFGIISGGNLSWTGLPAVVTLANGRMFSVDFQGGTGLILGDITTTATVSAISVVPLPAGVLLLLSGLAGFGGVGLVGRGRMIAT